MLIVGLVVGIGLPTAPNHIVFVENSTSTKVSLMPQDGDLIDFYDSSGNTMKPQFIDQNLQLCSYPDSTHPNECSVGKPSYLTAVWNYNCQIPIVTGPQDCFDPEIGPVSAKGQLLYGSYLSRLKWRLRHMFGKDDEREPRLGAQRGSAQEGGGQSVKHVSKHPALRSVLTPSVSCGIDPHGASVVQVFVPGDPKADSTLIAYPGDRIAWAPKIDFKTSGIVDAYGHPLCVDSSTSDEYDENKPCIVAKLPSLPKGRQSDDFSYTVNYVPPSPLPTPPPPSCGRSVTETVTVTPPAS
jgi:hypothetical protein